jgi:hypothetical protein
VAQIAAWNDIRLVFWRQNQSVVDEVEWNGKAEIFPLPTAEMHDTEPSWSLAIFDAITATLETLKRFSTTSSKKRMGPS